MAFNASRNGHSDCSTLGYSRRIYEFATKTIRCHGYVLYTNKKEQNEKQPFADLLVKPGSIALGRPDIKHAGESMPYCSTQVTQKDGKASVKISMNLGVEDLDDKGNLSKAIVDAKAEAVLEEGKHEFDPTVTGGVMDAK